MNERQLTKSVAKYLGYSLKGTAWTHFPAGEKRPPKTGALLKAMGLKPGWPDFQFLKNGKAYFIELKTDKGRLNDNQKITHEDLKNNGAQIAICRSIEEVEGTCKAWGLI